MKIPHSRPTIEKDDISAVESNLCCGQIASGVETDIFIKEMSEYTGTYGGVATNSGTNALHLALDALGIKAGSEVILPTYVCKSVLDAVNQTGAKPVFTDIEDNGYNIDYSSVIEKISDNTRAIIVPHMFGIPAEIDKIVEIKLPVIEDCAQSIGGVYKGKKLGSFGTLSIFSFYATKVMTTGHGGMVLTNSLELMDKLKKLTEYDEQENYCISHNFELTDFQAAFGRNQLKKLDFFIERRQEIADIYDKVFETIDKPGRKTKNGICYRFVVEVENPDRYIKKMKEFGVYCARPVFMPLHRYFGIEGFPNAERAMKRAISIPIYPSLKDSEIKYIGDTIQTVWS